MASIHSRTIIICATEFKRSDHTRVEDLAIEQLNESMKSDQTFGEVRRIIVDKHPVGWRVTFKIKINEEEAVSQAS